MSSQERSVYMDGGLEVLDSIRASIQNRHRVWEEIAGKAESIPLPGNLKINYNPRTEIIVPKVASGPYAE